MDRIRKYYFKCLVLFKWDKFDATRQKLQAKVKNENAN